MVVLKSLDEMENWIGMKSVMVVFLNKTKTKKRGEGGWGGLVLLCTIISNR